MTTLTTFSPRALETVADVLRQFEREKSGEWLTLTPRQHADHAERHLVLASLEEAAGNLEVADMHHEHAAVRTLMSLEMHRRKRAAGNSTPP